MKPFILSLVGTLLIAPAGFAIVDTNGNDLSDYWEREQNYGDLFPQGFTVQADPDLDGWTNEEEAAAGTNPLNPNPPDGLIRPSVIHTPLVMSVPDENGYSYPVTTESVTVSWPTIVGKQYTLLFSTDMSPDSWVPVGDAFIGNGNTVNYGFGVNNPVKFWNSARATKS